MSYVIQAVLSNAQHPEYGQVTIPFPIPNQNYDCTIELLEPLEIGDTLRQDCQVDELDSFYTVLNALIGTQVTLDELDYVDSALYLSQMDEIDHKLRELRKLRRRLLEAAGEDRQIHDTERMMEYLEDGPEWLDEVPSDLFGELLDRIIIISPERLKFRLLNGMELSENIERMVR